MVLATGVLLVVPELVLQVRLVSVVLVGVVAVPESLLVVVFEVVRSAVATLGPAQVAGLAVLLVLVLGALCRSRWWRCASRSAVFPKVRSGVSSPWPRECTQRRHRSRHLQRQHATAEAYTRALLQD